MTTFLVTGATGYIAKHIVKQLLEQGHDVVGSARNVSRDDEIRQAVGAIAGSEPGERYRTVPLDLGSDEGWSDAMGGVDVVIHTASPFPLQQPKDENDLIRPAVEGTRRALTAAAKAGVSKVVVTSSVVSIIGQTPTHGMTVTEALWTDLDAPNVSAYAKSKTLAEKAAWDVASNVPGMRLTTVNPGLVIGPALDGKFGTSVGIVERLLAGKDPAIPDLGFLVCDVRDVAEAHVIAATTDRCEGQRVMVTDGFLTFQEMAKAVKDAVPEARVPQRLAPKWLLFILGRFDSAIRDVLPLIGIRYAADTTQLIQNLGITPRSSLSSIKETAQFLKAHSG